MREVLVVGQVRAAVFLVRFGEFVVARVVELLEVETGFLVEFEVSPPLAPPLALRRPAGRVRAQFQATPHLPVDEALGFRSSLATAQMVAQFEAFRR